MSHFAIICPDDAGHLFPVGTLGVELVRRGHRVTVVARKRAAAIADQLGLPLREISPEGIPGPWSPLLWSAFWLFGADWQIGLRNGFCRNSEVLLERLPGILQELGVDGLLVDHTYPAAGSVADRVGLPFVSISSALPWNGESGIPPAFTGWRHRETWLAQARNRCGYAAWNWYMAPVRAIVNRYRRSWGLPPIRQVDDFHSQLLHLCQLVPEMDYPRRAMPPAFHYVGPIAARRPASRVEFPWDRLDGRPLIFASLGTVFEPCNVPVLRAIPQACGGLKAQLVLALGRWHDEEESVRKELGELPENTILVDFAPQLELLDRASLLITHAGLNTTMEALARAVPIVALPRSADQPGVAARVEYAGAGLRGSFHRVSAANLRALVERVLRDQSFRARAAEIQRSIAAAGGAARAAELVEQALLTGRPVPVGFGSTGVVAVEYRRGA